jgi:ATP-dependent DNA helicase RecG
MTEEEVFDLIASGEGQRVEFKNERVKPSTLAETFVAMANAEGGVTIIGVDDAGEVLGIQNLKGVRDKIHIAASKECCEPPMRLPPWDELNLEGKKVIAIRIPASRESVYSAGGRYLIRRGSRNAAILPHDLRMMFFERGLISFEETVVSDLSLEDLDVDLVAEFRRQYERANRTELTLPDRDLLLSMGCLTIEKGNIHPTMAGLLLFGRHPRKSLPLPHISIARYRGTEIGREERLDTRDFYGPLVKVALEASEYILENMAVYSRLVGLRREDIPQYPIFAVRELIINAVVHRDYSSVRNSRILIWMLKDRIKIQSPGSFPPPVTAENILHQQKSRNPIIARVFKDWGLIEEFGNGIDRVFDEIAEHPLKPPLPKFQDIGGAVIVTLYGAKPPSDEEQFKTSSNLRRSGLNDRQIQALLYIQEHGKISNREYCRLTGVSYATAYRDLQALVERGLTERRGSGRATYYVLK